MSTEEAFKLIARHGGASYSVAELMNMVPTVSQLRAVVGTLQIKGHSIEELQQMLVQIRTYFEDRGTPITEM